MELATMPITLPLTKKYKYYSVENYTVKAKEEVVKNEFFYLGKNYEKIEKLLNVFDGGYAAESFDNSRSILKRLIEKDFIKPIVIIADGTLEIKEIKSLFVHLQTNEDLCNIPVIVDIDNIDQEKQELLKKLNLIDDSISLSSIDKKFINRINFLSKVKKADNKTILEDKIETSLKEIAAPTPFMKRCFDILVSSILLILLSPVFLIIALVIKFESKGSIFYISKRAGRGYKVFDFYKFRTMAVDADKQVDTLVHLNQYADVQNEGPVFFKLNNDPRVTKAGTFLRNTSLDELPQLINVFLGDMSLVGNRPLPLYEAATLTTDKWVERFMAPAGITGLWQIKKRGQSDMSIEERLNLDIDYAKKHSFMFDLWIMANTPSALIQKSNV